MASRRGSSTNANKSTNRKGSVSSDPRGAKAKKDDYCCGSCDQTVMDDDCGVECEVCNFWFHCKCQNVSQRLYEIIHEEAETIHWYCRTCNATAGNMLKIMAQLQSQQASLQANIEELKKDILDHDQECKDKHLQMSMTIDEVRREIAESREAVQSAPTQNVMERLDRVEKSVTCKINDIEERERRKNNLIVFGLPESENLNPEVRKEKDVQNVKSSITQYLGEKPFEIRSAYRLGKKTDQSCRPLKVVMGSAESRDEILWRYRSATPRPGNFVQMSRDRTQKEREEYRLLRKELKERKENGEENLVIRKGKIIRQRFRDEPVHEEEQQ